MNKLSYEEIKVSDRHSFGHVVTEEMVDRFAKLTGDQNPLHMSEEYASSTEFGGRIVHGMFLGSFFSTLVGMFCPGEMALYLGQKLNFRKPLKIGEAIKVEGEVISKSNATRTIILATRVLDSTGQLIVDGEAIVRVRQ